MNAPVAAPLSPRRVCVVGAGPAGLMAAEVLSAAGLAVDVMDAMPSAGRKFLLAGRGGLNLSHAESFERFVQRYAERQPALLPALQAFGPQAVRDWAQGLGIDTFVGTSQRVFPRDMKAAPLLRAWLQRLRAQGVRFHMRWRCTGWSADAQLCFETPQGPHTQQADAVLLALGGASWPRLGSDGAWVPWLRARGVAVPDLRPSNCGFDVARPWSDHFAQGFAGQAFKSVALRFEGHNGRQFSRKGEFVATASGLEGSLVYAVSALLRAEIEARGQATIGLDLLPDRSPDQVLSAVAHPRGSRSLSGHLKSRLGLQGIKTAILYECLDAPSLADPARLAQAIKNLPIALGACRPVAEAISSAGGVAFEALDAQYMLRALPGVFCAGEMLDWEAPTGGYLLTACLATGHAAGQGVRQWLAGRDAQGV